MLKTNATKHNVDRQSNIFCIPILSATYPDKFKDIIALKPAERAVAMVWDEVLRFLGLTSSIKYFDINIKILKENICKIDSNIIETTLLAKAVSKILIKKKKDEIINKSEGLIFFISFFAFKSIGTSQKAASNQNKPT